MLPAFKFRWILLILAFFIATKPSFAQKTFGRKKSSQTAEVKPAMVYKRVDQMPQFNGDVSDWLSQNVHYPGLLDRNMEGRTVLSFLIDVEGRVIKPKIVRSSGSTQYDQYLVELFKKMPNWKPAIDKGKPVSIEYSLPISIELSNN